MKTNNPLSTHQDFRLAADGWCVNVERQPSPNHDERPAGTIPDLLVIHNITLPPGEFGGDAISALFQNRLDYSAHPYFEQLRPLRVSAHFLVRRDGRVIQFVSVHHRAWHAGVSLFQGRERCNDFSVGIEVEGTDHVAFDERQYLALSQLAASLCGATGIQSITGHSDIAPGRKSDPGPFFDWERFSRLTEAALDRKANPALAFYHEAGSAGQR